MATSPLLAAAQAEARELRLSAKARADRELELTKLERYALDPLALLNDGKVMIHSKETGGAVVFQPFETQIESLLAWIDVDYLREHGRPRFRNVLEEKSRQVGASWIYCYAMLWAITYHSVSGLALHLKAARVDDGGTRSTRDSLFGKIRYMHRRLPDGVGRARLAFRPFSRDPAKIENLDREAAILGEGATSDPGRGGAYEFVLVDEAAFIEWGEAMHSAITDTCPSGKAYISTVAGDSNVHARLTDERPQGWTTLRHHWSDIPLYNEGAHVAGARTDACPLCAGNEAGLPWDPHEPLAHRYPGRLTSPWYDREVIGRTDEQVAQELDIDRSRALPARVYTEFQRERHVLDEPIEYEGTLDLELGIDYGIAHYTAIVICQDHPREYRVLADLKVNGQTPQQIAPALVELLASLGVERRFLTPSWTRRIYGRGDPAGDARSYQTGQTDADEFRRLGFNFLAPPSHLTRTVGPSINAVKRLLLGTPKPLLISPLAEDFIRDMENNRWPVDPKTNRRRAGSTRPEDDQHNHMMRAFAYLIVSKFPPPLETDPSEGPGPEPTGRDAGVLDPGIGYGMSL